MSVPRCLLRFRDGARKFEDGYSLELLHRMPRSLFEQRMDKLNSATGAVKPTQIMVTLPIVSAFIAVIFYVIVEASKGPFERNDATIPFSVVFAFMLAGFVATAVLSRTARVRVEKAIQRIINEYNHLDNPNGINWRTLKYDVQKGFDSDGRPIYSSQLMLEIQVAPAIEPLMYSSYQRSNPERYEYADPSILEGGRYQLSPTPERSEYGEPSSEQGALPPPYKLVDAK